MVKITDGWFKFSDGLEAYERTWEPESTPRAHLVLLHGFSDRMNLYDTWATLLTNSYPIRITGYDRRGWGKTVHEKSQIGDTGPNAQILSDLSEYFEHVLSTIPDIKATPLFVQGHSMGGQESLYYWLNTSPSVREKRPTLAGLILDGPYIALDKETKPSSLIILAGKGVALFMPKYQMKQNLPAGNVCRDKAVVQMYAEDKLCHNTGTLEGLRDMLVRSSELVALSNKAKPAPTSLATKLPFPVLWAHGTADKVTDFAGSKQLFDRLEPFSDSESKVFKAFEECYHQIHSEPMGMKEEFARNVGDWVMKTIARANSSDVPGNA